MNASTFFMGRSLTACDPTVRTMRFRAGLLLVLSAAAGCGGTDARPTPASRTAPPGDGRRVRVPERDTTPPLAVLRLEPGGGAPAVEHRSPVAARRAPAVPLAAPEVRATALIRDADGGTGRIRLTVQWEARCGGPPRVGTVNLPPSQIVRIRLSPGVRAPVERRRTGRVRLPRGCRVTGEVFADATNASGLESSSDPVR